MTTDIQTLMHQAELLAEARNRLAELAGELQARIEAAKADLLPGIQERARYAGHCWTELHAAIKHNPQLFERPRTVVHAGVKFGLAKGKGKVQIPDEARTIRLITDNMPERSYELLRTEIKPDRAALSKLTVRELARIGAQLVGTDDEVVITPDNAGLDRLLKQLVAEAIEEQRG
jgi:hypothetical protein